MADQLVTANVQLSAFPRLLCLLLALLVRVSSPEVGEAAACGQRLHMLLLLLFFLEIGVWCMESFRLGF
ncbi:hypothetical protein ABW45_04625 [Stenotrophomonas maltophilia]|nr:hypothetical protein ABW45_04625 [Stenotrophomonas maltophilia]